VSVLRPLVVPGVATTILYVFLFSWTEFVGALTLLTSNDLYTLPLALLNMEYGSVGQVNFGFLEAGAVIAMIPCLLLYVALQRYHIRGLTSGASRTLRRGAHLGVMAGHPRYWPGPRRLGRAPGRRRSSRCTRRSYRCAR